MTETLTRTEELRISIDNMCYSRRYIIQKLAELEQMGLTHSLQYKQAERNLEIVNHNIRRVWDELEKEEAREYDLSCFALD